MIGLTSNIPVEIIVFILVLGALVACMLESFKNAEGDDDVHRDQE